MKCVCACAVCDTSVSVDYGIFLYISYKGTFPISPTPLTGHSSAGQRTYWGSSISYVLSYNDYGSIMQFLKQKAKKLNL